MTPDEATSERTPSPGEWFRPWLARHKVRNPHQRFAAYEAGSDLVYQGWVLAFAEERVTRGEATLASKVLQRRVEEKGLFPEHHLAKILAIVRERRAARAEAERVAARAAAQAEAATDRNGRAATLARYEAAWQILAAEQRGPFLDEARAEYPALWRFPAVIEAIACSAWAGQFVPAPATPAPAIAPRATHRPADAGPRDLGAALAIHRPALAS